ncbi:hypothetical protein GW17_00019880 [Ensete ventricosum]|nr:hypothetical protein GW17_00019880 [Ensete ventricosum]
MLAEIDDIQNLLQIIIRLDVVSHTGYGLYVLVCQLTGTRTTRYRAVPPSSGYFRSLPREIDRQRSISTVADHYRVVTVDFVVADPFWAISVEGGREKKREKTTWSLLRPRDLSPAGDFFSLRVENKSPLVGRRNEATPHRPRVARGRLFSCAGTWNVSHTGREIEATSPFL